MQNSFVNRGQKGPKTSWRKCEEKRGIPKSTIKVAVLNALQVLRNAPKDAKWQGNINFNPTSLHKVSNSKLKKKKGKTIVFFWCSSAFWRLLFCSPGEDQTHQVGTAPPHWCSSIQAAKARFPWKILFWLAYFTVFLAFSDSLESLKKLWLVCGVDSFWDRERKPEPFRSAYGLVETNFGISNCSY